MTIDHDKAKELAEEIIETCENDCSQKDKNICAKYCSPIYEKYSLAAAYLDLLDRQRWIPVKERLPESMKKVQVICLNKATRQVEEWGFYNLELEKWDVPNIFNFQIMQEEKFIKVTHWRYPLSLPDPPESEANDA